MKTKTFGNLEDLKKLGRGYAAQARSAQYLCEIPMTEEEQEHLLDALAPFWRRFDETDPFGVQFALTVGAVNFAYFQLGDEPFREPFLKRLGLPFDSALFDNIVGKPVEKTIKKWSGRGNPNAGKPYRYVGLIREQAGLPKHRLAQFANWLSQVRASPGWAAIRYLSPERIGQLVGTGFAGSHYAREFLSSESGVDFVRSVTADLTRYFDEKRLTRSELATLPFYRHGFMLELVAELERLKELVSPTAVLSRASYLDPVLSLDDDAGRLCLRFEHEEVLRGAITCDQLKGKPQSARVEVGEFLPLSSVYTGRRVIAPNDAVEWRALGWDPTEDAVALFDASGPLVWRSGDQRTVAPGEYLLVVGRGQAEAAIARHLVAEHAALFLLTPDPREYRVCRIQLDADERIEELGLRVAMIGAPPRIEALGMQPWSAYAAVDVVWAPNSAVLHLRNWTAENALRFRVGLRIGDSIKPLTPAQISDDAVATVDLRHLPLGTVGTILLEAVGRRPHAAEAVQVRSFAILPRCEFGALDRLYNENEPVLVSMALSPEVQFACHANYRSTIAATTHAGCWVPPEEVALNGTLRFGDARVDVSLPVRRAGFLDLAMPHDPLVLDAIQLKVMHVEGFNGSPRWFRVRGMPRRIMELVLEPVVGGGSPEVIASVELPESGERNIQLSVFLDAVRAAQICVGRFALRDSMGRGATQALFVDSDRLLQTQVGPEELARLPEFLSLGLRVLQDISRAPTQPSLDVQTIRPASFQRHVALWCAAACIFDNVPSLQYPEKAFLHQVDRQSKQSIWRIRHLLTQADHLVRSREVGAQADHIARRWKRLGALDRLKKLGLNNQRWVRRLEAVTEELTRLSQVRSRLNEFISATKAPDENVAPEIPGNLLLAARYYYRSESPFAGAHGQLLEAVQRFTAALGDLQPLWAEVNEVLYGLAKLRLCRVRDFARSVNSQRQFRYARRAQLQLSTIRCILRQVHDPVLCSDGLGVEDVSPRQDDCTLGTALALAEDCTYTAWRMAANSCWIGAYLGWRQARAKGAPREIQESLRELVKGKLSEIPDHPDKDVIGREIEADQLEAWV